MSMEVRIWLFAQNAFSQWVIMSNEDGLRTISDCGKSDTPCEHRPTPMSYKNLEFCLLWLEHGGKDLRGCWIVILQDGSVLPGRHPAMGYAANEAYAYLGKGESDFEVTEDTGQFYRFTNDNPDF